LWIGGGFQTYWLKKGIGTSIGVEERRSLTNGGAISNQFNRTFVLSKPDWEYFDRFQFFLHIQSFYFYKKNQLGLRLGLPIGPVAKNHGQRSSLRSELIYRLAIFTNEK